MHETTETAPVSARAHLGTEPALADVARENYALVAVASGLAGFSVAAIIAAVVVL